SGVSGSARTPHIGTAIRQLPVLVDGAIGLFGWCDTPMPHLLYLVGRVLLGTILVLALIVGTWTHRLLLIAIIAVAAAVTTFVVASNPGVCVNGQARYSLAIAVLVPLLCGHVLAEKSQRFPNVMRVSMASA